MQQIWTKTNQRQFELISYNPLSITINKPQRQTKSFILQQKNNAGTCIMKWHNKKQ